MVDRDFSGKDEKKEKEPETPTTKPKRFISKVKEDSVILKYAKETFQGNDRIRDDVNALISRMKNGNMDPGIGSKSIGNGISELRSDSGGRVYFRNVGDTIEVLAYSNKSNEQAVINRVMKIYAQ